MGVYDEIGEVHDDDFSGLMMGVDKSLTEWLVGKVGDRVRAEGRCQRMRRRFLSEVRRTVSLV